MIDQYTLGDLREWAEARDVDTSIRIIGRIFQIRFTHKSGATVVIRAETLGAAVVQAREMWDSTVDAAGKKDA